MFGALDGLAVIETDPVAVVVIIGRGDGMLVIDNEGQINEEAEQFMVLGSQHVLPPPLNFALGLVVIVVEGQIFMSDLHCILVGSQHPIIGVGVAVNSPPEFWKGDGVIILDITSVQRGRPGVQEPSRGSQHMIPL